MHEWVGKVVVITGASAGIGRATAVALAHRQALVIVAARRPEELEETARRCRAAGGRARAVVTDVTREEEVRALASAALEHGRIDVWINNAGVTLFAPLEEGPFEEHRRVLETNLIGSIFGARVVIPIFRRQRHGVLINVGSILSQMGQPFVPSYVISKFGVRGLTEALRVEMADEPDIHVCTFMPYAVETQHFEAGANRVGKQARPMPPVQSPEKIAAALVRLAARPRRERRVPYAAVAVLALHAVFPRVVERLLLRALTAWHFSDTPERATSGNLFRAPKEPGATHGRRAPLLGSLAFAVWTLRELGRMGAEAVAGERREPSHDTERLRSDPSKR